ncbi:MAG: NAD(P)/FAD-dependent oxidoreductase [Clostridium sp.]|nr:NAD(P)/FAD-dependent oxidoreductase [Clostridium sp.]MBP3216415.1 NAD(P)/FAD-dependent oxidoreductase [Clostridium sp.]
MVYDVLIIGAGVTGAAVARELSRYKAEVCVLERGEDVCSGTSKANSAIVHAGYDCVPGSMMAKMNVRGNEMMTDLCRDLDIPFERNGSLVVCIDKDNLPGLQELYDRGIKNGVPGMKLLSRDEAKAMEPHLSDNVQGALYAETAGIICPFKLNIAMAENANVNGVDFFFNTNVEKLCRDEEGIWHLRTSNGEYKTKCVVNAAGLYSDYFHNMVSSKKIHITPRRGDYFLLDKTTGGFVKHTIFPQPTKYGKGILVAPTIHGNTLVGPTAIDIDDKEDVATRQGGFDEILAKSSMYVDNVPVRQVITSFAGLRAHEDNHEFILGEVEDAPGFIDCAGIESPGLTSSPAIGEYIGGMIRDKMDLQAKESWISTRKDVLNPQHLSLEERNELIKKEPAYGRIICRCESVTEGEILDAIHRPLGARSLDAVKRRTRAGMGRCQAGFCSPRVMEILQRELGLKMEDIHKNDSGSWLVLERTKEVTE